MEVSLVESVLDLTQEHQDLRNRNMKDTALGQTHPQDQTQVCIELAQEFNDVKPLESQNL